MSEGKTIARAALIIIIMTIFSRISGFLRELAIAHQFGATAATDAYVLAYTLPFVTMGVLGGAIAATTVPIFTEYSARGRSDEAWKLFSTVLNTLLLGLVAVAVLGMFISPQLVSLMAPGFTGETRTLAILLMTIMLPSLLFMVLSNLFMGLLNANNVFGPPAAGPAVLNTTIIIAALTLGSLYGIKGLAFGAVAGSVLAAAVQIPFLIKIGFKWYPVLDFSNPGVRKLFGLMLPVLLTSGMSQGYLFIERILASGLDAGSIAALNYANKLVLLPQGLFVFAVSAAIFPTLSRKVSEGKAEEMAAILAKGVRLVFLVSVPAGVGLMALRVPVISLLFERGAFDVRAVNMTATALLFYSIGLVGLSVNPLLSKGFFAMQDMWTPFKATVAMLVVNIAAALLLVGKLQHGGLALAYSLAVTFNMIMLVWFLQRRVSGIFDRRQVRFYTGVVLASGLMGIFLYFFDPLLAGRLAAGDTALLLRLIIDIGLGLGIFLLVSYLLKLEELTIALDFVRKKVKRSEK